MSTSDGLTETQACIGIIANPASGKDVRRLVARASVFNNKEKAAIINRAIIGAVNTGARNFAFVDDTHNISKSAANVLPVNCRTTHIESAKTATSLDTEIGAAELAKQNCIATLILGGDGTCRAFVKGWRAAVLLPLSTGTNNAFPSFVEATVAGAALGILASGKILLDEVVESTKIIDIEIEGEQSDIALIDAVATTDRFVGSRALLDASALQQVVLTNADPMGIGMTSLGGLIRPLGKDEDIGLHLQMGKSNLSVHAPIAPGFFETVEIKSVTTIDFNDAVSLKGPCLLAFDGERERLIKPGQKVTMRLSRSGPRVLDVKKIMHLAAYRQLFTKNSPHMCQEKQE
ncbi:MAG: hypothetical protein ACI9CE_000815 [Flavobacterium sp.]|jgi:hypothetical protein